MMTFRTQDSPEELVCCKDFYGSVNWSFRGKPIGMNGQVYFSGAAEAAPDSCLKTVWLPADVLGMQENALIQNWLYQENEKTEDGWVSRFLQYKTGKWQEDKSSKYKAYLIDTSLVAEWEMRVRAVPKKGISVSLSINGGNWVNLPRETWQQINPLSTYGLIPNFDHIPGREHALLIYDLYLRFPSLKRFSERDMDCLLAQKLLVPEEKTLAKVMQINRVLWTYTDVHYRMKTQVRIGKYGMSRPAYDDVIKELQRASRTFDTEELKAICALFLELYYDTGQRDCKQASFYLFLKLFLEKGVSTPFQEVLTQIREDVKATRAIRSTAPYAGKAEGSTFDVVCFVLLIKTTHPTMDPWND